MCARSFKSPLGHTLTLLFWHLSRGSTLSDFRFFLLEGAGIGVTPPTPHLSHISYVSFTTKTRLMPSGVIPHPSNPFHASVSSSSPPRSPTINFRFHAQFHVGRKHQLSQTVRLIFNLQLTKGKPRKNTFRRIRCDVTRTSRSGI